MTNQASPRIMKAEQAREMAAQIEFNLEDIRTKCEAHIDQTKQKVREMLTQAHEEAKAIHQKAFEEGREKGKEQGLVDAEESIRIQATEIAEKKVQGQFSTLTPALESAVEKLRDLQQQCLVRWESEAVHLATTIAEKISRQQIKNDPSLVVERVVQLIRLTIGETDVRIRLHADDAKVVEDAGIILENSSNTESKQSTHIIPDSNLLPGDCKVESSHGTLDATIEEQLKRIASELCH